MGVTIVICAEEGCGRMLNGELCDWERVQYAERVGRHQPYCIEHAKKQNELVPVAAEIKK